MTPLSVPLAVASLAAVFVVTTSYSPRQLCNANGLDCGSPICSDACDAIDIGITDGPLPLCSAMLENPPGGCGVCTTSSGTTIGLSFSGMACLPELFNHFIATGLDLTGLLDTPTASCTSDIVPSLLDEQLLEYFCTSPEQPVCATDLTCPAAGCIPDDSVCPCGEGNTKNCGDFPTQELAQECFKKCGGVGSDVHKLDGNGDGVACKSRKKCLPPGPVQGDTPLCAGGMTCPAQDCFVSNELCPCTAGNTKNCADFPTKELAQACFEKCNVHGLDGNGDGVACHSRPACVPESSK